MAKPNSTAIVLGRFSAGADLTALEVQILDAMAAKAIAGNPSAAKICLAAIEKRRAALKLLRQPPALKLNREALA